MKNKKNQIYSSNKNFKVPGPSMGNLTKSNKHNNILIYKSNFKQLHNTAIAFPSTTFY